jgi:pilus assembly protein CpaB
MNWKVWAPLGLAIVMGVLAAKVGYEMVSSAPSSAPAATNNTSILVAAKAVAPGTAIEEPDLVARKVPAEIAPAGSFTNAADVVGRVASVGISTDQPITEALLVAKGAGAGAQALVPEGMRAITIEVNEFSGVAGLLVPGCRVDVITSLREESSNIPVARTIVQNVRVMAVGQKLTPVKEPPKEETNGQQTAWARCVTLVVTPAQAEAIDLASSSGRPRLVLRGTFDNLGSESKGITVAELMGTSKSAAPTTAPAVATYEPRLVTVQPATKPVNLDRQISVQVIRGTKESRVDFVLRPGAAAPVLSGVDLGTVVPGRSE